jgi:hypothetical protein
MESLLETNYIDTPAINVVLIEDTIQCPLL